MKRAVVLVDHGSRRGEANALVDDLARALAPQLGRVVKTAHMEIAEPTLAQAIDACVAEGAAEITVLPFFLAPGRHTIEDVPVQAAAAAERHPGVTVRVAGPIGNHPGLVEILHERLREAEGG